MRTYLLLNGPTGWQTGIEDGFNYLLHNGEITALKWIYFEDLSRMSTSETALATVYREIKDFRPDVVIWFHVGRFPVPDSFIPSLRKLQKSLIIIYDEGDMYGGWQKPFTASMKCLMRSADVVSIRGLGRFQDQVSSLNRNVIYTPHHADIARFDSGDYVSCRKRSVIFIGNQMKSSRLGVIKRIHGAHEREKFVTFLSKNLGKRFELYGNGWEKVPSNRGAVEFQKQIEICKNAWFYASYEHYPEIPFYFSNRLPIALLAGCIYICHHHRGYEKLFPLNDFLFTFKGHREALDVITYLQSLPEDDLLERSHRARMFALRNYTPDKIWSRFLSSALSLVRSG